MLEIGKKLEAINPCVMKRDGIESLIVGKEYEIIDLIVDDEDDCIVIIDEQKDRHYFPIEELSKWFKTSN